MGVQELLAKEKPQSQKVVAVKLPVAMVEELRNIREAVGKSNSEVYTALLSEGIKALRVATGLTKNGRKRGRPRKAKSASPAKKKKKPINGRRKAAKKAAKE